MHIMRDFPRRESATNLLLFYAYVPDMNDRCVRIGFANG